MSRRAGARLNIAPAALRYHACVNAHPWIFGYGSLVWRPAFPYRRRRPGFIRGYVRRFWQASTDHRGTPEAPGRVATLIGQPGAVCWGMAYEVGREDMKAVLEALDHREKDGYERILTRVTLQASASHDEADVDALVYIAGTHNPRYLGPTSVEEIAAEIQVRHGPSGSNREYVLRLAEALADMGAEDPHVLDIMRRIE